MALTLQSTVVDCYKQLLLIVTNNCCYHLVNKW